jgi:oligopeptidase B
MTRPSISHHSMLDNLALRRRIAALLLALCLAFVACQSRPEIEPPSAQVVPKQLEAHGQVRTDNYYWLRERENPEVTAYLRAENDYTDAMMASTKSLQETLFQEFKTRIKQTDVSVPYKKDDYYYYSRVEEGKDYPVYCRRKGSADGPEEVLLDVNELAAGHEYFSVSRREVSAGQDLLAYAVDTAGRRIFDIRFKNLANGETLPDLIPQVTPAMAWANDNKTLFYARQDPLTLRSYRIYRHVLGSDPSKDELVFEESDDTFSCYVFKTKSKKYLMIGSSQTLSSEFRYLDADKPQGEFQVVVPRQRDHEYSVDHFQDQFFIRTNYKAKNFRLMKTAVRQTGLEHWQEVIPHREDVLFEDMEIFRDNLVAVERKDGLVRLRVLPWSGKGEHYVDFGEPAYQAFPTDNYDLDTPLLRYNYTSMATPDSVYDYSMATREKTLLKRDEVLGGFDSAHYQIERIHAAAPDGEQVPISLVYRRDLKRPGANPLLLYGYGSYGYSIDPSFDPFRVSLLDRGFVFALAHIRGGEELGRRWYEDGKLLKKKNTFTDFIACAEYLIQEKYADPKQLYAEGGSAGGLLIGAAVNMRPDLFRGVVAAVPFVDVVTTMLDAGIPLTTSEYDEWGNPNERPYYDYILSYSPYDQVEAKDYPNMLVLTSLPDSQVQYWEPAKWVAKLRALKTDHHRLLLKTEFEASHGGVSGRDKRYREKAFELAFLVDLAGIRQ